MTAIDLRPVRPDDVPAVVALVKEVLAEFGLQFGAGSPTDADLLDLPGSYRGAGGELYEAHGFVRDDTYIRGARFTRGYVRAL